MCAVTCSDDIVTEYCSDNNINFFGGEAGHFAGEASAPQIP